MHLNIHFFPIPFLNETNLTWSCAKLLLKSGWPIPNHIYKIHDHLGHLNEHRFNHNFDSCINPLCSCRFEVESTKHFFLHCHHYTKLCKTVLNTDEMIKQSILNINYDDLIEILLFGNWKFSLEKNSSIIKSSINCIKNSERFDKSFFEKKLNFFAP